MKIATAAKFGTVLLAVLLAGIVSTAAADEKEFMALVGQIQSLLEAEKLQQAIPQAQRLLAWAEREYAGDQERLAYSNTFLGEAYRRQGRYAEAEPLLKRALALREATHGPEDYFVSLSLNNLAGLYRDQGRYNEAEALYKRSLTLKRKIFGDEHAEVALALNNLASIYYDQGRYPEVEPLYKTALEVRVKTLGADHLDVAQSLYNLGLLYYQLGRYAESKPLHERSIKIRENALAPDHPYLADNFNSLAALYLDTGQYALAEPLFLRAKTISEKAFGHDHPVVAQSLHSLAMLYDQQGRFSEVEPHFQQALAIRQNKLGPEHPYVAMTLDTLANFFRKMGRYAEAEKLYGRALEIFIKAVGPQSPSVAMTLNDHSTLLKDQSRYAEAEALVKRALEIYERVLGGQHPNTAGSLQRLASVYHAQGRYAEAETLYQRALTIYEKTLGPDHPDVADTLNSLGILYSQQDRHSTAEPIFQRALKIREKAYGTEHAAVGESLHNLAQAYQSLGRLADAEPLLRRSLALTEKSLGPDHVSVANPLHTLALLYDAQNRFADAETFYRRALTIWEKVLGPNHPDVAFSLHNLASMYHAQGRLQEAEPLITRAIKIRDVAGVAAGQRQSSYGLRAEIYWKLNQRDRALADLRTAIQLAEQERGQLSGGEQERAIGFAQFADAYEHMVQWQCELGNVAEAYSAVERSRARSLVDQLATANIDLLAGVPADEVEALRTRRTAAQSQLARLEKQAESILADKSLSEAEREQRIQKLEDELRPAREEVINAFVAIRNASPVYRQMVGQDFKPSSLADIQSRLVGPDGLLLEFFLGRQAGYVLVIPSIGNAVRIEMLTVSKEQAASLGIDPGPLTDTRMRAILSDQSGAGLLQQFRDPKGGEQSINRLATLWQVLIPETERKLLVKDKLKHCIVIPDAALAAFPFDTLVVELGEKPKYLLDVGPPIVTAPSATLLMNLSETNVGPGEDASKSPKKSALLSVADPNYGVPSTDSGLAIAELSARSRYGALRGDLKALPFTGWECSWVTETFRKAGLDAGVLKNANAREASVRMYAPGRKYLHFACHGLVDQSYGNLFGALALTPGPAGTADPADDGFLTLAEIYELNLRGTELSILSACDTNYGPNQKGEGVWSLSRGFLVAGSRRVVASNWLVDDEAGASLISVFCGAVAKSNQGEPLDYAASLQAAKRWVRNQEKWRSPYYWGTFVLVGPN